MQSETELLTAVLEARKRVGELDALLAEASEAKQNAERSLIEYMDNRDLKSFRSTALNCQVVRKETLYVSIDKERKEEAFRFIQEDLGRGDGIKPSIHNKTLTSLISELLKEGKSFPQDLFKYFFRPELMIIQAKTS